MKKIGKGTQGTVYEIDDTHVLKITKSKSEYDIACKILNSDDDTYKNLFCKIYSAEKKGRYYHIVKEKITPVDFPYRRVDRGDMGIALNPLGLGFCPIRYTQTHPYLQDYREEIEKVFSNDFDNDERKIFTRFLEIVGRVNFYKGDICANLGRNANEDIVLYDFIR